MWLPVAEHLIILLFRELELLTGYVMSKTSTSFQCGLTHHGVPRTLSLLTATNAIGAAKKAAAKRRKTADNHQAMTSVLSDRCSEPVQARLSGR
jgi:hypothetical protein